jgi:hypothetical protein
LLFVPGASAVRSLLRISAYAAGLLVWAAVVVRGRRGPGATSDDFPARPWLAFSAGWLLLSVAHPNSYSVVAALAQAMLYLAVMSPAFWGHRVLDAHRQLDRVMVLLFACNALSALVGMAQVYRPQTFNPPVIPALNNKYQGEDLMIQTPDGRKVLRPCGLTDSPGGASAAGSTAAIIGLCLAVRPVGLLRRLASLALALVGVAVIYYSYIRLTLIMVLICLAVVWVFLLLRRRYAQAAQLAVGGALALAGALAWAVRSLGGGVLTRFVSVVGTGEGPTGYSSRAFYVQEALGKVLWEHPLGYGMGWWGQIYAMFGTLGKISPVWVEVMIPAWVYDGGFPLLLGYGGAVAVALYDSARIALTSRDGDVQFWAAVVVALNASVAVSCLSYVAFVAPLGVNFWLLAAVLHAADRQSRAGQGPPQARPQQRPQPAPAPRPSPAGATGR